MKYTYLFFLFITSSFCVSQNIEGYAYYSKKLIKIDSVSEQNNLEKKQLLSRVYKGINNIKKLNYELVFNDSLAKYTSSNSMSSDIDNNFDLKFAKIFSGFTSKAAYYDLKQSKILFEKEFLGEKILVESKIDPNDWTLTKEKQIINNIICFKATKKIKKLEKNIDNETLVIAWYAPSINVNYGPDGYAGLPGLILQLQINNVITFINRLDITNKNIQIYLPKKTMTLSQKKYDDLLRDFNENRSKYFSKRKKQ